MENENPFLSSKIIPQFELKMTNNQLQEVTKETVFQLIRNIRDPEHPYTLEKLSIVNLEDIKVGFIDSHSIKCRGGLPINSIEVIFTPTVPHCSMASIIGLSVLFQLRKYISNKYLITVQIKEQTHNTYLLLNKQLSDKDRVMAAFENDNMHEMLESCINDD